MPTSVQGANDLRKALKKFAPDLAKETQKELGKFLKPVVRKARGYIPVNDDVPSGWLEGNQKGKWERVAFNSTKARRGIGYKTTPSKPNRSGFRALISIINKNAAGAIYETAGRKSGNVGLFTPRLDGILVGPNQKRQGRAMFRAWSEDQGRAKGAVLQAIFKSKEQFNIRVKAHSNG
jgi:hypothetical protein